MRIVITGGAGYKGVLLADQLLAAGHDVTVLDNFMYGTQPVIGLLRHEKLKVLKTDVRITDYSWLKGHDVVVHLAGISGYPACQNNPYTAHEINVEATRRIAAAMGKDQVLIYASTTSFYGSSGQVCSEETPVQPVSVYGRTKYEGECAVMERENSISLRFATVFGVSPKMRPDLLVNDFALKAVNDRSVVLFEAHTKRTFVHIDDTVNAYVHSIANVERMAGRVFNVGSNDLNHSKMDIAQAIRRHVDFTIIDSEVKDFDVRNFVINYDRIGETGFSVKKTLDDGVQDLVRLYQFYRPYAPYNII